MSYYNIDFYFYARLSFTHEAGSLADILVRFTPEQRKLKLDSNHLMSAVTSDLSRENYSVSTALMKSS